MTVLVPAAVQDQVDRAERELDPGTPRHRGRQRRGLAGRGPILQDKGIFLIPDIIANAGGVIVSYFEWVQDLQAFFWEEEEINTKLDHVITRAFYVFLHTSVTSGSTCVCGLRLAVQRVANATTVRGIYP